MISEIIDNYLLENKEDWEKKRFYASDLGQCKRKLYYRFRPETPKEPSQAKSERRKEVGKFLQEYEAKKLREIGILEAEEIGVDGYLGARYDWLLNYNERKVIAEVKTLGDNDIRLLSNALEPLLWVKKNKREYLWQLLYYLKQTGIGSGLLHFIGLNGKTIDVEVNIDESQDEIEAMKAEIEAYATLNMSEEAPRREGKQSKGQCSYCEYKEHCWKDATPEEIIVTEDMDELVLDYLTEKEKESEVKAKIEELREKIIAKMQQIKQERVVTPIGGVKLSETKTINYKDNLDKLRELLEPKGLFFEVLEASDKKVKDLIKAGYITADDLLPAASVSVKPMLTQIKL